MATVMLCNWQRLRSSYPRNKRLNSPQLVPIPPGATTIAETSPGRVVRLNVGQSDTPDKRGCARRNFSVDTCRESGADRANQLLHHELLGRRSFSFPVFLARLLAGVFGLAVGPLDGLS